MTIREYFQEFRRENNQTYLERTIYGQYILSVDESFGYSEVRVFDGIKSRLVALLPTNFSELVLPIVISVYEKGLEDGKDSVETCVGLSCNGGCGKD